MWWNWSFTNKFLHRDDNGNDDYIRNSRGKNSINKAKKFRKEKHSKRSFISKESEDEYDGSSNNEYKDEYNEFLFMAFEFNSKEDETFENFDIGEEVVINLEQELIYALDDLDDERRKCKKSPKS